MKDKLKFNNLRCTHHVPTKS